MPGTMLSSLNSAAMLGDKYFIIPSLQTGITGAGEVRELSHVPRLARIEKGLEPRPRAWASQ